MARVITFSRTFPSTHPKKGEPTYFVEKFWQSIQTKTHFFTNELFQERRNFRIGLEWGRFPKNHTIRAGNRWKKGDYFSPRVWSGKPYNTPQIILSKDTLITDVWDIKITKEISSGITFNEVYINNKMFCPLDASFREIKDLAKNDGLEAQDLIDWFTLSKEFKKTGVFKGQIISWNENIKY